MSSTVETQRHTKSRDNTPKRRHTPKRQHYNQYSIVYKEPARRDVFKNKSRSVRLGRSGRVFSLSSRPVPGVLVLCFPCCRQVLCSRVSWTSALCLEVFVFGSALLTGVFAWVPKFLIALVTEVNKIVCRIPPPQKKNTRAWCCCVRCRNFRGVRTPGAAGNRHHAPHVRGNEAQGQKRAGQGSHRGKFFFLPSTPFLA